MYGEHVGTSDMNVNELFQCQVEVKSLKLKTKRARIKPEMITEVI